MKATINGIQVEGTVSEILEFKKALDNQSDKIKLPTIPYTPYPYPCSPSSPVYHTKITCNN